MQVYKVAKIDCYHGDDVLQLDMFKSKNARTMATTYIPDDQWRYARINNLTQVTDGKSNRFDKVFVTKSWIDEQLAEAGIVTTPAAEVAQPIDLPLLLDLEDHELFRDSKGNLCDIEVRGTRHHKDILFNAKDIGRIFGFKDLIGTVRDSKRQAQSDVFIGYEEDIHFKNFSNEAGGTRSIGIYLTQKGLLKTAFASRSINAEPFTEWVTKLVYTAQFGTIEQRVEMTNSTMMKGVDYSTMRQMLTPNCPLSAIYLFKIGYVRDLKTNPLFKDNLDNLNDNHVIFKFGKAVNIIQRFQQHSAHYKTQVELVTFAYVEEYNLDRNDDRLKDGLSANSLYRAEGMLRKDINQYLVKGVPKEDELIAIDPKIIGAVLASYASVRNEFGKNSKEIEHMMRVEINDYINEIKSTKELNEVNARSAELEHLNQIQAMKNQHDIQLNDYLNQIKSTKEVNEANARSAKLEYLGQIQDLKNQHAIQVTDYLNKIKELNTMREYELRIQNLEYINQLQAKDNDNLLLKMELLKITK